jgi:hypothetical protein
MNTAKSGFDQPCPWIPAFAGMTGIKQVQVDENALTYSSRSTFFCTLPMAFRGSASTRKIRFGRL